MEKNLSGPRPSKNFISKKVSKTRLLDVRSAELSKKLAWAATEAEEEEKDNLLKSPARFAEIKTRCRFSQGAIDRFCAEIVLENKETTNNL